MKTICIDFDGTIHNNKLGYLDGTIYGEPAEGAVFTITNLCKEYRVVVFTARQTKEFKAVKNWLKQYGFPKLEITNKKIPALCYVDDKAIRFTTFKDLAKYYL